MVHLWQERTIAYISVNYILCPHCTTKISEETILANADCRGKVAMLCPTCSESLRFRLRGTTLEHLKARYAELAPEGDPVRAYLQLIANDFAYAALLPLYVKRLSRSFTKRWSQLRAVPSLSLYHSAPLTLVLRWAT